MKIGMIAAIDVAGKMAMDGSMPWDKPKDLERFRKLTSNSTVIMGRKTYESIGRPLPNRTNIVVTKNPESLPKDKGIIYCYSLSLAIDEAKKEYRPIWIIGGQQIYQQALDKDLVDFIDLTIVNNLYLPKEDFSAYEYLLFPQVPYTFSVESEYVNLEDNELFHRKYVKREISQFIRKDMK